MKKLEINFLGVVRNGGLELKETLRTIDIIRSNVARSNFIVATEDNSDDTDSVLDAYQRHAPSTHILRLDGKFKPNTKRQVRIATARNFTLEALFASPPPHPGEFTIILDLDGLNAGLNTNSIYNALLRPLRWDALFANQTGPYYDIYALRCEDWCNIDVWQYIRDEMKFRLFGRHSRKCKLIEKEIHARQYNIPPDTPLIPVKSAFGGLGIYRTEALRGLRYSCKDKNGRMTCEHVPLHLAMKKRGANLFIDPNLLNSTPKEHIGRNSGADFPISLIAKFQ